jgi:hypothetical protein
VLLLRPGRGRPRLRPGRLVGDKGYTGRRLRNYLRRRGIRLTISKTTLMNRDAVRLIVKFIVNATLLNALSTDSSNFDVSLPDMRNLLQIIQP